MGLTRKRCLLGEHKNYCTGINEEHVSLKVKKIVLLVHWEKDMADMAEMGTFPYWVHHTDGEHPYGGKDQMLIDR